ncbi:ABC transporter substrate binding protein [Ruminiclostridium cellulolyticum]|uniref:Diguanylate cyclase/phosphodiesterase n=1 Tax=Ruminiclostridium cellulolyticum (strain ATCC 35319 / DSM 5812 / JCM 6584 / H10) TaxID=394503 RepID=B8I783_RUMCH|nr:ABC transporter substrate binding protein [Ruminiclostridium cellulolyticum]ACL75007.1 diguanylate cyclase/phosphodiesterase [Ruminiclostridium cellulolyticum H10]
MTFKNVKKVILTGFVIVTLLLFFESTIVLAIDNAVIEDVQPKKNILILHSYNEGLAWTSNQNTGIIEMIDKEYPNTSTYVEYMDWKNYPTSNILSYLSDYFEFKYTQKHIDLIITTDDAAFKFALLNRKQIFSDAPIVFSGVNQEDVSKIAKHYKNYTGVIENIDPTETFRIALRINPNLKKVYVVFDNSESGLSTGRLVMDKVKAMNLEPIPMNNMSFNELLKVVSKLDNTSIVFFATYYSDGNGKMLEFNLASREISKYSSVPLYHQYDFGLNKGAFGGDMVSGRLCGNYAAKLAVRILKGESASDIKIISPKATRVVFDYEQLKRFEVPVWKLPKTAEIINKPFSFFETYKRLVVYVIGAFSILTLFLVVLLVYIRKIRNIRKQLYLSNEELTQTYEELVASDEELRHQLDEIRSIQKSLSQSEEKYNFMALHDVLTGLPNRRSLLEDSSRFLGINTGKKTVLLFIDMDNFKYINDTMGHEFGDELINKAGQRLKTALKDLGTLYRLGGDEFILLIYNIENQFEAEDFMSQVLQSFKDEFEIGNSVLHITFSIGAALYPDHGNNIEDLIKCADIAMYKAKEQGKNRYVLYDRDMDKAFSERMTIEKLLHTAMDNNEFEVYYQPQFDLQSQKITGLEALLRWKSSELGNVSPIKFIKVAEDTHLIIPLGEWVLNQACAFVKELHEKGLQGLTVSVNISTIQILQSGFTRKIIDIINSHKLNPECLELEITETILIESFTTVFRKLNKLKKMGIRIALDDFGKGYSSLNYLKQLPISTLKIDKSFIDSVSIDEEGRTITRHIITLGKSLGMTIIAEGVEFNEQLEYLKKYHCDRIQGYLFSKPLPGEDVKKLLIV